MLSQFVIIDEGSSVHDNTLHVLGACNNNNLATLGSDEWRNKFTCLWTYISLQRDFCPGSYFQRNPIHTELQSWIKCAQYMPGQFQCDNYLRPVFTLTSFELVQRTFAILSCILLGIALILMLVGMETSKIFLREENVHIKMKLMKVRFLQILQFPKPYRPAPGVFADRLGALNDFGKTSKGASILIFAAAFMLLYNASTFAAQISNEFFYNQFYTETGIGSRVSYLCNKGWVIEYFPSE